MKFSLLHPSRGRPEKSFDTISKWIERAFNTDFEIIVSLDNDDLSVYAYFGIVNVKVNVLRNYNYSAVDAINYAAEHATGQYFIVVSDDTDCPMHWDRILLDAIGQSRDFVMKVADGIQKRIITMPIMDRPYYNRDKNIYDPVFRHSWADTWLTELAHHRGRVIQRPDISFPHLHYSVTGEQPDALYKRNDMTHDQDRRIFQIKMRTLQNRI